MLKIMDFREHRTRFKKVAAVNMSTVIFWDVPPKMADVSEVLSPTLGSTSQMLVLQTTDA